MEKTYTYYTTLAVLAAVCLGGCGFFGKAGGIRNCPQKYAQINKTYNYPSSLKSCRSKKESMDFYFDGLSARASVSGLQDISYIANYDGDGKITDILYMGEGAAKKTEFDLDGRISDIWLFDAQTDAALSHETYRPGGEAASVQTNGETFAFHPNGAVARYAKDAEAFLYSPAGAPLSYVKYKDGQPWRIITYAEAGRAARYEMDDNPQQRAVYSAGGVLLSYQCNAGPCLRAAQNKNAAAAKCAIPTD
ncbi:MAG: hypothetical protein LBR90_00660, partial [Elusimicrobiota bacterium]|nr:hypothetical protein [Elusimicrobiota bacterium]